MGLDGVSLLMRVEETFGIAVPDEDAQRLRTVGDLREFIESRVILERTQACMSSRAFYWLRASLIPFLDVDRSAFRRDAELSRLIPRGVRRAAWGHVVRSLGLKMPRLSYPPFIRVTAWLLFGAPVLAALTASLLGRIEPWEAILLASSGVGVAGIYLELWKPLATRLPRISTFGELAREVARTNHEILAQEESAWSRSDVQELLEHVVVEELGVDVAQVTDDARFVEDLQVG